MVAVTHSISQSASASSALELLCEGLLPDDARRVAEAHAWTQPLYGERTLGTREPIWQHALGSALIVSSLRLDADARIAALCFAVGDVLSHPEEEITARYGQSVARLVDGLRRLNGLRVITRMTSIASAPEIRAQSEVLRKMLLAMVEDIRVVLLRVASRTQTLRFFTDHPGSVRDAIARESLDIYAPLANRLGLWQLKWEVEDLSFRFLEPETYKRIARMLDERRIEREQFIVDAVARLKAEVAAIGIKAEVYGRPKHIYSIYNKLRAKRLDFSQIFDVRALRVLVDEVKDCYAVLGIVHQMWTPIPKEFDDYISMPKGNNYQSLHTAVYAADGRALEVQIRTHSMHNHAELGVAAHWRYKEGSGGAAASDYDEKIALLRSLLSWRDEVTDAADWLEQFKRASLDDTIYVLTPQGRVIDMPRGATPIDFAYRVHTDLGHRCRGAKVNGQLVTLNTPLENGQTVEIMSTKEGGPSRDWLNPHQNYVVTPRARQKIKQYFSALEEEEMLVRGRSVLVKEIQREGHGQANIDELAGRLGFKNAEALFIAAGRGEVGPRAIQIALRGTEAADGLPETPEVLIGHSHTGDAGDTILIVGVGKLMTSLGRCCKPAPPDAIQGYVTRGRGVSIHRIECQDFQALVKQHPERLVSAEWGGGGSPKDAVFAVDILVHAMDRQGLLRDISEVLSREKLNVIAVNTLSRKGAARMRFTLEVHGVQQIQRALKLVRDVKGVTDVERG